ncbi:MAG TPA: MerR family transcriptional regulator [Flavobacteriales bacterium]|jgi:DNA-binding transcriptional MerR regulator|nr:MerR family transcriptional regulator [Flavobacteriales bacterium]HAW21599.1 MerR family transcriptional regulator [Flavobacteriales bacterium]
MPYKEKESFKLYYSIGEVSELLSVNPSLLRFWEKEFDVIRPSKNKKGNRIYKEKDVKNLKLIHYLVKERGFTLEGAKKKLKEGTDDLESKAELIERLGSVKNMLLELKHSL